MCFWAHVFSLTPCASPGRRRGRCCEQSRGQGVAAVLDRDKLLLPTRGGCLGDGSGGAGACGAGANAGGASAAGAGFGAAGTGGTHGSAKGAEDVSGPRRRGGGGWVGKQAG